MVEHQPPGGGEQNETAVAYYALAQRLVDEGSWEKAVPILEEVVRFWPGNFEVRLDLGKACFLTNRIDQAIAHLQYAQRLKPDDGSAHKNLGQAYLYTQQWEKAVEQFEALRRIDEGQAVTLLAEILFGLNYGLFKRLLLDSKVTGSYLEDAVKFARVKSNIA